MTDPDVVTLHLRGREEPIALDLAEITPEHAAWIERKRLARGEEPTEAECLPVTRSGLPLAPLRGCRCCGQDFRPRPGTNRKRTCPACLSEIARRNGERGALAKKEKP